MTTLLAEHRVCQTQHCREWVEDAVANYLFVRFNPVVVSDVLGAKTN